MAVADDRPPGPPAVTAPVPVSEAPTPPARGFVHLKTRADFLRVARGARFQTTSFSLQAAPGGLDDANGGLGEAKPARFGLTVTKKTGAAVKRNRIRRRLREALRAAALAAKPGHDYVLVARQEALVTPFTQLTEDVRRALEGIHARRSGRRRDAARAASMAVRPSDLDTIDRRRGHGESNDTIGPGQTHSGENQ